MDSQPSRPYHPPRDSRRGSTSRRRLDSSTSTRLPLGRASPCDLFSSCFPSRASNSAQPIDSPSKVQDLVWCCFRMPCWLPHRARAHANPTPMPARLSISCRPTCYALTTRSSSTVLRLDWSCSHPCQISSRAVLHSFGASQSPSQTAAPSFPTASLPSRASSQHPLPRLLPPLATTTRRTTQRHRAGSSPLQQASQRPNLSSSLPGPHLCATLPLQPKCFVPKQPILTSFPDVPTIEAIWTAFGTLSTPVWTPLANRYSPNIFTQLEARPCRSHAPGLDSLTNQAMSLEQLSSASPMPCEISAQTAGESASSQRAQRQSIMLPDHGKIVKLDERIRRYHAVFPTFCFCIDRFPSRWLARSTRMS